MTATVGSVCRSARTVPASTRSGGHRPERDPPGHPPVRELHREPADRGVAPQYQNGTGPPAGLGSIVTSLNEELASEYVTSFSVKTRLRMCALDLTSSTRSRSPQPIASNSCWNVPAPTAEDQPRPDQLGERAGHQRGDQRVPERDQRAGAERDPLGDRADRGQRRQRVVEGPVRVLHLAVRLEHQVVAYPDRVEAELPRRAWRRRAGSCARRACRSGGAAVRTS